MKSGIVVQKYSICNLCRTRRQKSIRYQIAHQQAEAIAKGEESRMEVWRMIADDRQQLRLKLRDKYNEDFE